MSADGHSERRLVLRPQTSAPQQARDFVAETLSAWRLEPWQEPAVLITSELVTNAVHHAGTELAVRILRASSEVRIEVSDGAADRELRVGAPGARAAGGVGLVIVERLADAWGVDKRRNGKSVWVRLAVDRGRRPAWSPAAGTAGTGSGTDRMLLHVNG
ncbi:ATP-binding protein [Catenulispora sp. NL8]|uniref:ATP-binding protein n=1 Tax=Catenulispora pinistramenti TaxID=2705254 RepID=A0ABS5KNL0_9ACTN|nr:ATP-binding protein [Catenulispora pinistramenti]MBS2547600.1 ATP-binding protein [Catenulispora pinistramenti]